MLSSVRTPRARDRVVCTFFDTANTFKTKTKELSTCRVHKDDFKRGTVQVRPSCQEAGWIKWTSQRLGHRLWPLSKPLRCPAHLEVSAIKIFVDLYKKMIYYKDSQRFTLREECVCQWCGHRCLLERTLAVGKRCRPSSVCSQTPLM